MDLGRLRREAARVGTMIVRPPVAADRVALLEALERCGAFSAVEVEIAIGMIDEALAGDYTAVGVEVDGALRGYTLLGRATLTERSWYLYWICMHPAYERRGFARALQRAAEDAVQAGGGDKIVLETSGRPGYARSRAFYEGAGYAETGRIRDFYSPGDDCIIYCKRLPAA